MEEALNDNAAWGMGSHTDIYGHIYDGQRNHTGTYSEAANAEATENEGSRAEADDPANSYGVDEKNFAVYDERAPRVTDKADIFTDEEETALEMACRALREALGRDIVIYTDVTSYGKEQSVCAADFFENNGYGCGADREGACLFVCMDPDDRGWWTACHGQITKGLYTVDNANDMDDVLLGYFKAENYAEGVLDWIGSFRTMYETGYPFTPAWMPDPGETISRFHNADAPRIDDAAKVLNEEETAYLKEQAAQISRESGLDVVVHFARYPGDIGTDEYADLYYKCNGYGYGDSYDGIALITLLRGGIIYDSVLYTSGNGGDKLTPVNKERLMRYYRSSTGLYEKTETYLKYLKGMEKTGRVARTSSYWLSIVVMGLLIGGIFGGITYARTKAAMNTVEKKSSADVYMVPGSLAIRNADKYSNTTRRSVYSPVRTEDRSGGSSSGSGRSSYSSSYSSSSGSSYSGSGRRF